MTSKELDNLSRSVLVHRERAESISACLNVMVLEGLENTTAFEVINNKLELEVSIFNFHNRVLDDYIKEQADRAASLCK